MSVASDLEILMLGFINEEREANGLDGFSIDGDLNEAAEDHSDWMIDTNIFSHTGINSSSAGDRMEDAGYQFSGSWTWGENIAYVSIDNDGSLEDEVERAHENLMESEGHRDNILSSDTEEIGIGIEIGEFTNSDGNTFEVLMVTQNFARSAADNDTPGLPDDIIIEEPEEEEEETPVVVSDPVDDPVVTEDPIDTGSSDRAPMARSGGVTSFQERLAGLFGQDIDENQNNQASETAGVSESGYEVDMNSHMPIFDNIDFA